MYNTTCMREGRREGQARQGGRGFEGRERVAWEMGRRRKGGNLKVT